MERNTWIKESELKNVTGRIYGLPLYEDGVIQRWFSLGEDENLEFELRIFKSEYNHFKCEIVLLEDGWICDSMTDTIDVINSAYDINFNPNDKLNREVDGGYTQNEVEENQISYMDIKEFREQGYLQELNRRFLHPLGLALEVKKDEEGNETISGVWDCRNDEEGVYYGLESSDKERLERFEKNAKYIDEEFEKFKKSRTSNLGFQIEPIKR